MLVCDYESPLGLMLLAQEGEFIVGLWFREQKYFPNMQLEKGDTPLLKKARTWLDRYFAGERPSPEELPLAPHGTAFRQEVWKLLMKIPYGETSTYGLLAQQMAQQRGISRMSAQAVGGAVGHNPISIIIPCHRVLGTDGSLTGYAGGLERKAALLAIEEGDRKRPV